MSEIGKPLYENHEKRFAIFKWFCVSLLMLGFGFMTYLCWVEQIVTMAGRYGQSNYQLEGTSAVKAGYFWSALFFASFAMGFIDNSYERLIWLVLAIIWLFIAMYIHFQLVIF